MKVHQVGICRYFGLAKIFTKLFGADSGANAPAQRQMRTEPWERRKSSCKIPSRQVRKVSQASHPQATCSKNSTVIMIFSTHKALTKHRRKWLPVYNTENQCRDLRSRPIDFFAGTVPVPCPESPNTLFEFVFKPMPRRQLFTTRYSDHDTKVRRERDCSQR